MRLIDADVLPKLLDAEYKQTMKLIQEGEKHLDTLAEGFAEASHIAKYIAPTVDAVPVVPCKGCGHAERYARTDGTAGYYCGHPQNTFVYGERWDRVFKPVKEPDDFCSFGKRKEDENGRT